jgi:hypothetical protein
MFAIVAAFKHSIFAKFQAFSEFDVLNCEIRPQSFLVIVIHSNLRRTALDIDVYQIPSPPVYQPLVFFLLILG